MAADDVDRFQRFRPRLEAIAYRLLGSAHEAEDVVQETFLRWHAADVGRIEVPEAWLTKVLTNLCLNQLTSARARRESYPGQWLPEPLIAGDPMLGPADTVEQRESVSFAVLTVLERLTPHQRVAYVLREAFGYSHREIGDILGISETAGQQIFHRAKKNVGKGSARNEIDDVAARRVVEEFLSAATSGRIDQLVRLLTDDAISVGDGGGKVPARSTVLRGAAQVAFFVRALFKPTEAKRNIVGGPPEIYAWTANGEPAAVAVVQGAVVAIMCLEVTVDGIAAFRTQANPDKLTRATRQWASVDHGENLLTM